MPYRIILLLNWYTAHIWNFIASVFFAFFAYFTDLKGAFHVMFASFVIDIIVGVWHSVSIKQLKFSMYKFFIAIKRMLIAFALVMLLYAADKEMGQDTVRMSKTVGYLITGFVIYSIAENGYKITGGRLFISIKSMIRKKVQDNTGIDIDQPDNVSDKWKDF